MLGYFCEVNDFAWGNLIIAARLISFLHAWRQRDHTRKQHKNAKKPFRGQASVFSRFFSFLRVILSPSHHGWRHHDHTRKQQKNSQKLFRGQGLGFCAFLFVFACGIVIMAARLMSSHHGWRHHDHTQKQHKTHKTFSRPGLVFLRVSFRFCVW